MLMGRVEGFGSSKELLLADPVAEIDGDESSVDSDNPRQILYMASFEELAAKNFQYDMVIWVLISLMLILAWGIGILMLLYLPMRRYVLQKDIASRKLYVTPNEIVYKVSRPSFIPFWGGIKIQKHVPLHLVIDIIIEQGCLQSIYGLHTLRIESIAHGGAAAVDELQVQGVYNPGILRKVIVMEASKAIREVGRTWKPVIPNVEGESIVRTESLTESPCVMRSPSQSWKTMDSPRHSLMEHRVTMPAENVVLHKLEEVNKSVKKIESLIEKSRHHQLQEVMLAGTQCSDGVRESTVHPSNLQVGGTEL